MKVAMTLVFLAAFAVLVASAGLLRFHYIVIDGHVPWWQVQPIVTRGAIHNDREYRAVLYYVEQIFESGGFERPAEAKLVDELNVLLADYHTRTQGPAPDSR